MAGVGTALSIASTGLGMAQKAQQTDARNDARMAAYRRQQRQQALKQRIEERRIERARKRAKAEQRARAGAAGISGTGGSTAALLTGLDREFDQKRRDLAEQGALAQPERPNLLDNDIGLARDALSLTGQIVSILPD